MTLENSLENSEVIVLLYPYQAYYLPSGILVRGFNQP
jgi:hypothetical protein